MNGYEEAVLLCVFFCSIHVCRRLAIWILNITVCSFFVSVGKESELGRRQRYCRIPACGMVRGVFFFFWRLVPCFGTVVMAEDEKLKWLVLDSQNSRIVFLFFV